MYCPEIYKATLSIGLDECYVLKYYAIQYPHDVTEVLNAWVRNPQLSFDSLDRDILLELMEKANELLSSTP